MSREVQYIREKPIRILWLLSGLLGLIAIYLLQQKDFFGFFCSCRLQSNVHFAFNRFARLLANDLIMLFIIHTWFHDKSITRLAIVIGAIDMFILLPVYLFIKLSIEGSSEISSPLLSQFHRLIVNPTLLIMLIPAIYFQRISKSLS